MPETERPGGAEPAPLLEVQGLDIHRPDGIAVLTGVDLRLLPGQVLVLLGASGAGKSTLMNAINDAAGLRSRGFTVDARQLEVSSGIGIVPQRGALFDHLSVAGNLKLAMRNAEASAAPRDVDDWLASMHLPSEWSTGGDVAHVSGGEAQRLAVARTLAGGRKILFLDEPSVGLDPYRVLVLARLLRGIIQERNAGAIVVTHDLVFAAAFGDRFFFMDRDRRTVSELDVGQVPSGIERSEGDLRRIDAALSGNVIHALAREPAPTAARRSGRLGAAIREMVADVFAPFAVVPSVLASLPLAFTLRLRDFLEVIGVVLKQTLFRPTPFFAIVSTLIGYSVLYIFHRSFTGGEMPLRDETVFGLIGGRHIIALVPPLSGILFTATSGNAVTAWLGGISLTKQSEALRALGVPETRYLWVPSWVGLMFSYLLLATLFCGGMVAGGALYLVGVESAGFTWDTALQTVTAQLVDPQADEWRLLVRAGVLLGVYSLGIPADTIAKGAKEKTKSEAVTISMVKNVMASTLWIVTLELASLPFIL